MPILLSTSKESITDLKKLIGKRITIIFETVSITQTGHSGDNEYWIDPPETYRWEGKVKDVLPTGILGEGSGGFNYRIEYDNGYKKVNVQAGLTYFPFKESEETFLGKITESGHTREKKIVSIAWEGKPIYERASIKDSYKDFGNHYFK